jgi:dolichol-phosphate mannosyltransferase
MSSTVEFPTVARRVRVRHGVRATHLRFKHGIRHPDNWRQLVRFLCVGTSGYAVNLAVFAVSVHAVGIDYRLSSVIAFLCGCANNFSWNRHWTFDAAHRRPAEQGLRFFLVSLLVFGFAYATLVALVTTTGMEKVLAQAIANVAATPLSFLAQKLWSFKA